MIAVEGIRFKADDFDRGGIVTRERSSNRAGFFLGKSGNS